jgi:hypothetical protein
MSGFIPRIIGKAERVSTVLTDVLGKPAAFGQEVDVVACDHADRSVANLPQAGPRTLLYLFQKRVTAEAGVLLEAVAGCDVTDPVAEETAEVAHLLLEGRRRRVRIALGVEEQRMAALGADVFVTAVPIGELLVIVLAEEARQCVTNARDGTTFSEVFGSAPAAPGVAIRLLEDMVVDVMTPQETR